MVERPCVHPLPKLAEGVLGNYLEGDDDNDVSASELGDAEEDNAPVGTGVAVKRVTLEHSKKEINALRSSRKNTLYFTAWVYSDLLSIPRLDAVTLGNYRLAEFFSIWLANHKTP